MGLAPNSLTDYETVAAELGLSGTTDQALIWRLIGVASSAIEAFTRRELLYQAGLVHRLAGQNTPHLLVPRMPLAVVQQVALQRGVQVLPADGTDYVVDEWKAGCIYRRGIWPSTALRQPGLNFTQEPAPGSESADIWVTCAGGYLTGPQAAALGAWPSSRTLAAGALIKPTGKDQVWVATPTTAGEAATTGAIEPTWGSSPLVGDTLTDGTVTWTYLGSAGSAGARGTAGMTEVLLDQGGAVVALPQALEEACVVEVKARYIARRRDPSVTGESVGSASKQYGAASGQVWTAQSSGNGTLHAAATALAAPYRRLL